MRRWPSALQRERPPSPLLATPSWTPQKVQENKLLSNEGTDFESVCFCCELAVWASLSPPTQRPCTTRAAGRGAGGARPRTRAGPGAVWPPLSRRRSVSAGRLPPIRPHTREPAAGGKPSREASRPGLPLVTGVPLRAGGGRGFGVPRCALQTRAGASLLRGLLSRLSGLRVNSGHEGLSQVLRRPKARSP